MKSFNQSYRKKIKYHLIKQWLLSNLKVCEVIPESNNERHFTCYQRADRESILKKKCTRGSWDFRDIYLLNQTIFNCCPFEQIINWADILNVKIIFCVNLMNDESELSN